MLVDDPARTLAILAHLAAFGTALVLVLQSDLRLVRARSLDAEGLARCAWRVQAALCVVVATGVAVLWVETGLQMRAVAGSAVLMAKAIAVLVLAGNGIALHRLLIPRLGREVLFVRVRPAARLAASIGAVSIVSWFYLTLLSIVDPLAGKAGLGGHLALYALMLVTGLLWARAFVAPHAEQLILAARRRAGPKLSDLWAPAVQPAAQLRKTAGIDVRKGDAHRARA